MPQREVHLRDYLITLRKHDFFICLSFLLIVGTALTISIRLPKTYSASTLIELVQPTSSPPVSSTSLFQSVLSGGVDRTEMETIAQRFSTESMLKSAIENLENEKIGGVRYLPSVGKLRQSLKARIIPDTYYIQLSVRLTEEEGGERNAALLMNQLVAEIQSLRRQKKTTEATQLLDLLNGKLTTLFNQVELDEEQALKFAHQNGSPLTWFPMLSKLIERRAELREQLEQIKWGLEAAQLELNHLHREIEEWPEYSKLSETMGQEAIWQYRREHLESLELQRLGLTERASESAPEVKGIDAQIKSLRNKLSNPSSEDRVVISTTDGVSPIYTGIQERLIDLRTSIPRAEHNLQRVMFQLEEIDQELQQSIEQIPGNELTLDKLKRGINARYSLITEIYKQILEAEILLAESSLQSVRGGIEIVDAATPRKIPVSPRLKFILVIAGVIGGSVGISIALLMEYFGNT
ncbi:MAG: GumC family protein [Candidatus Poribacteria bacterium]